MSEIIEFEQIKRDSNEEKVVFAIPQDGGDLKPMEEWNGEDWALLIDGCFGFMAAKTDRTKWDFLAEFMHTVLNSVIE